MMDDIKNLNYNEIPMILLNIVDLLFWVYMIMLFVRILGSWIPEWQSTRGMQFVAFYTDPYLNVFRRIIPPLGMLDLSPMLAFFSLSILEAIVKQVIVTIII